MADYVPPTLDWVRRHVELYEGSGGTEGATLGDTGLRCILVTYTGKKTGATRKMPLMRVKDGESYLLFGSMGGAPNHPAWVHNLRAKPRVQIRDRTEVFDMTVREIKDEDERARLWALGVEAFPPYDEYQAKTARRIPVFRAEPD